jgi:cytochrome c
MRMIQALVAAVAIGSALPAAAAVDAAKAEGMAKDKGCLACHTQDKKLIGPPYKEVAKKYKSDAGAPALLVKSVMTGSTGKWGPIPMPPNKVTEDEAKTLVAWVLSL